MNNAIQMADYVKPTDKKPITVYVDDMWTIHGNIEEIKEDNGEIKIQIKTNN